MNKYFIDERIAIASDRLLLLSNLRRGALQRYFSTAEAELQFWSSNKVLIDQQIWFNAAWNDAIKAGRDPEQRLKLFYIENNPYPLGQRRELDNAGDGSGYSNLHAKLHPLARVMYGEAGQLAGVIALQLPTSRIVDVMSFDAGMRETGERYLVGGNLLMRSNSRFSKESTVLKIKVNTATVRRALLREYGVQFAEDYRGVEVLSAYSSTEIDELTWAVMAEIDKAEVLEPETNASSLLVGLMLFFYSLGIWSSRYIQRSAA